MKPLIGINSNCLHCLTLNRALTCTTDVNESFAIDFKRQRIKSIVPLISPGLLDKMLVIMNVVGRIGL